MENLEFGGKRLVGGLGYLELGGLELLDLGGGGELRLQGGEGGF